VRETSKHDHTYGDVEGTFKCTSCGYPEFPPNMFIHHGMFFFGRHAEECDCFDCRRGKTKRVSNRTVAIVEYGFLAVLILSFLAMSGLIIWSKVQ